MVAMYESSVDISLPAPAITESLDELEQRLERGMRIIEQRSAAGLPIERHEVHWLELLRKYENLYDSRQ